MYRYSTIRIIIFTSGNVYTKLYLDINNLLYFQDEFWMEPYKTESTHSDVILSGTGSSPRKHDATTAIYLNVSHTRV